MTDTKVALSHFGISVYDFDKMVDFYTRVMANAWALYARDPEGNAIELFVDSPWHVTQPCGFPLNLELSDEEIDAETEAYCHAQPGWMPMTEFHSRQAERIRLAQRLLQ